MNTKKRAVETNSSLLFLTIKIDYP